MVIFLTHYINQANRILRNYFPTYFFGEEYLAFRPSKISRVML